MQEGACLVSPGQRDLTSSIAGFQPTMLSWSFQSSLSYQTCGHSGLLACVHKVASGHLSARMHPLPHADSRRALHRHVVQQQCFPVAVQTIVECSTVGLHSLHTGATISGKRNSSTLGTQCGVQFTGETIGSTLPDGLVTDAEVAPHFDDSALLHDSDT